MKTFIVQEKFVGYNDITIYAETEEEAISLYNKGYYKDSDVERDDMFYDFHFCDIREDKWHRQLNLNTDWQRRN